MLEVEKKFKELDLFQDKIISKVREYIIFVGIILIAYVFLLASGKIDFIVGIILFFFITLRLWYVARNSFLKLLFWMLLTNLYPLC